MLVATGGALGAILRYLLTNISKSMFASSIYGTISVNILGSFLIGYFITSNIGNNLSENFVKFFLIIGLLGSFTTFSAFSYEIVELIISKKIYFIIYLYFYFDFYLYIVSIFRNLVK